MPQPESPQTNSLGLKAFNQTGRNDTTTEVLRSKGARTSTSRNLLLIAIVVVAFAISAYFVYDRSGVDFKSILNDPGHGLKGASEISQDTEKSDRQ